MEWDLLERTLSTYLPGKPWHSRQEIYFEIPLSYEVVEAFTPPEDEEDDEEFPPPEAVEDPALKEKLRRVHAGEQVELSLEQMQVLADWQNAQLAARPPKPRFHGDALILTEAQRRVVSTILDETATIHANLCAALARTAPARLRSDPLRHYFDVTRIRVFETPYRDVAEYVVHVNTTWEGEVSFWMRDTRAIDLPEL